MAKHHYYPYQTGEQVKRDSCTRKVKHDTLEDAQTHADWMNNHPRKQKRDRTSAYKCRFCDGYHVGRGGGLRLLNGNHRAFDPTMIDELGERAYWCGAYESEGLKSRRMKAVMMRLWAAHNMKWMRRVAA